MVVEQPGLDGIAPGLREREGKDHVHFALWRDVNDFLFDRTAVNSEFDARARGRGYSATGEGQFEGGVGSNGEDTAIGRDGGDPDVADGFGHGRAEDEDARTLLDAERGAGGAAQAATEFLPARDIVQVPAIAHAVCEQDQFGPAVGVAFDPGEPGFDQCGDVRGDEGGFGRENGSFDSLEIEGGVLGLVVQARHHHEADLIPGRECREVSHRQGFHGVKSCLGATGLGGEAVIEEDHGSGAALADERSSGSGADGFIENALQRRAGHGQADAGDDHHADEEEQKLVEEQSAAFAGEKLEQEAHGGPIHRVDLALVEEMDDHRRRNQREATKENGGEELHYLKTSVRPSTDKRSSSVRQTSSWTPQEWQPSFSRLWCPANCCW